MSEVAGLGALEIGRRIARGELSSVAATTALIERIQAVDRQLNAVVVPMFESALAAAAIADERQRLGEALGPLHGVPVTIKECFHAEGTPSCIGLSKLKDELLPADGVLVERLRRAGAIVLGKTNVPQLMLWHECDNPVYGRTNNPWDLSRTPGGSSGGEAAIIAAGGSPLGLGGDLGGSIRVPAHFCGIAGIKPTSYRLPRDGSRNNFRGLDSVIAQPGPMARRVEDLTVALRVLVGDPLERPQTDVVPAPLLDPAEVRIEQLRIAYWEDDGFFPASPAVRRAVREAAEMLRQRGARVEAWKPDFIDEAVEAYTAIMSADGGADGREMCRGSTIDWRLARLMAIPALWRPTRTAAIWSLHALGQKWMARTVRMARRRSARSFWQQAERKNRVIRRFLATFGPGKFDAFLCPPHALPAMQHGKPVDLMPAASYAFAINLLGIPAGCVPVTRVQEGEDGSRADSRDQVEKQAKAVDAGSVGLPVGVQVGALPWREDIVLGVMEAIESQAVGRPDYPGRSALPI